MCGPYMSFIFIVPSSGWKRTLICKQNPINEHKLREINKNVNTVEIKSETALLSDVRRVIKPPTFDVETVWSKYRRQFEAVAESNKLINQVFQSQQKRNYKAASEMNKNSGSG